MAEFSYELKIPHERVAVLIGTEGAVKKELEELTNTKLRIDSKEGDVFISGEDPLSLYSMKEMVIAIGRGFNPDIARLLIKPDYCFELINILDYCKTKNDMLRLKGRVIGTEGKSRRIIEELTEVSIVVYGKTVGLIGEASRISTARKAVELILKGSPHSKVYRWLERQRKQPVELKQEDLISDQD